MSDTRELIAKFRAGLTEAKARATAEAAGATVRRRMRTDSEEEVMLLLEIEEGDVQAVKATLDGSDDVTYTEINQGGFGIR